MIETLKLLNGLIARLPRQATSALSTQTIGNGINILALSRGIPINQSMDQKLEALHTYLDEHPGPDWSMWVIDED